MVVRWMGAPRVLLLFSISSIIFLKEISCGAVRGIRHHDPSRRASANEEPPDERVIDVPGKVASHHVAKERSGESHEADDSIGWICGELPRITDGIVFTHGSTGKTYEFVRTASHGTEIHQSCVPTYHQPIGTPKRSCTCTTQFACDWDGSEIACEPPMTTCPKLSAYSSDHLFQSDKEHVLRNAILFATNGTVVRSVCRKFSYLAAGSETRTCECDGDICRWSGKDAECWYHGCLPLHAPLNGFVRFFDPELEGEGELHFKWSEQNGILPSPDGRVSGGSQVVFKCADGYRISGSEMRMCDYANVISGIAQWTGVDTRCEPEQSFDAL